jgi:hypothetical protein
MGIKIEMSLLLLGYRIEKDIEMRKRGNQLMIKGINKRKI